VAKTSSILIKIIEKNSFFTFVTIPPFVLSLDKEFRVHISNRCRFASTGWAIDPDTNRLVIMSHFRHAVKAIELNALLGLFILECRYQTFFS